MALTQLFCQRTFLDPSRRCRHGIWLNLSPATSESIDYQNVPKREYGWDVGTEKAASLDQAALESQAPLSVQEAPLRHTSTAAPVPDGVDYRQAQPPPHYHTPQPVIETLDQVLQSVVEATQYCAADALNKSNSTITLSDDSVEIRPEEPAAAEDDADVVVLDETTNK